MEIEIRKLTPELLDDYLDYFDNAAFTDHKEWAGCNCVFYHWDDELEAELKASGETKTGRSFAADFVRGGIIRGYLAYCGGKAVGWCNANDKSAYRRLAGSKELWDDDEGGRKVKAVVCFSIRPDMRGKGIATQLLERVSRDAAEEGYEYAEAYPFDDENDVFINYHGPYNLYKKAGFVLHKKLEKNCIVRKYL